MSQNWAQIKDDENDEENVEEPQQEEENKTDSTRPAYPKKTFEKKIEQFPTKGELITAIQEHEDPFVQLYICKANYNAQVQDVLQVLKPFECGFIKQIKDGLFVVNFQSHDRAINFIKQTPQIMDRPYFLKLSNYNPDKTGWQTQGNKSLNEKQTYKKTFDNNKAPRNPRPQENRKNYGDHVEGEEELGGEAAAENTNKNFGKGNRYENFTKPITRGTGIDHTDDRQQGGEGHDTIERNQNSEDAPPGVHKKREYNNNNNNNKEYNNNQEYNNNKEYNNNNNKEFKSYYNQNREQAEDPNKPKEEYKPRGFMAKGATTQHQKSDDIQSDLFGGIKPIIPKEIAGAIQQVEPTVIAQDLNLPTTVSHAPEPKSTHAPAPVAPVVQSNTKATPAVTNPVQKQETQTEAPVKVQHQPATTAPVSNPIQNVSAPAPVSNNNNNNRDNKNETKQKEVKPEPKREESPPAPVDEWQVVSKPTKAKKNKK